MRREVKQVSLLPGFVQSRSSGGSCWVLNYVQEVYFGFLALLQASINQLLDEFMDVITSPSNLKYPSSSLSSSFGHNTMISIGHNELTDKALLALK
jgi:hypothetical protein